MAAGEIRRVTPRPTILTFVGFYLPGYKAGGPIQSIANLVAHLGGSFDFRIVTRDRDSGDATPYPHIEPGRWQKVGRAQVLYLGRAAQSLPTIARVMRDTRHDGVYLNSFFSARSSSAPLLAHKLGLAPHRPTILAPRGEFSAGALTLGSAKKRAYIAAVRAAGLHRDLLWHASTEHEAVDIRSVFGPDASIHVASNLPRIVEDGLTHAPRTPGQPLRVLFLSRISPKKNLIFALEALARASTPVALSIVGPVNNEGGYWAECQARIAKLPAHITASYDGVVPAHETPAVMARHDLFFLPTLGENFGHAIIEALSAGTPVLISDQTPWRNLETAGCGWAEPLDDPQVFADRIDLAFRESPEAAAVRRAAALNYARRFSANSGLLRDNQMLFEKVAGK